MFKFIIKMFQCFVLLSIVFSISADTADNDLNEFSYGNNKFAAIVYKELAKKEPGNIIFSPLSAETILAVANEGARAETSSELTSGLSFPNSTEKIQNAFKNLFLQLKTEDEKIKLQSANKIYANKDVKLEDSFKSIATTVYDSGVENIDFTQANEAAEKINSWVEGNTNNKIRNLISPESITADTKLALVNALYFSAKWFSGFDKRDTQKKTFYKSKEDTVEVDTLHQVGRFGYYESSTLKSKFLQLPYEDPDFTMVIALPNDPAGLATLEQNIEEILKPQRFFVEEVIVALPKFTVETDVDFVPILKSIGVQKAFGPGADFSGLSSTYKDLYISDVRQKAFVNVTEEGTEAAAATFVRVVPFSAAEGPPLEFKADHPFSYYIRYKDIILFAGRYTSP